MPADSESIAAKLGALRRLGVPYSDEEIKAAPKTLEGKTEMDALVAYLQGLGTAVRKSK
jgi:cytochrome c oxidase cbb3-type subunit 2